MLDKYLMFVKYLEKELGVKLVLPQSRRNGTTLVPVRTRKPCETCTQAEYNKLCSNAKSCAAMLYHTILKMDTLQLEEFLKGDKCTASNVKSSGRTKRRRRASSATRRSR
jgi:hypothetical protein